MGQADGPRSAVRCALYLLMAGLCGRAAFALYGLRAEERTGALPLRPWLITCAALALLLSLAWLAMTASEMAGTPVWPVDRGAVSALLAGTAIGLAWKARVTALVVAVLAGWFAGGRAAWLWVVTLASGAALATLAWTGHGAMGDGAVGWVHLLVDILHLVAAGVWTGALLGLVLLVARPLARVHATHLALSHRALHGFGMVGTVVVGTLIVTGLVNGWALVGTGNIASLGATLYGRFLVAKLALFAAMLGVASLNRFRLTPALKRSIASTDHGRALATLRRSLALETALAVAVLALVAWLGMLEPPAPM